MDLTLNNNIYIILLAYVILPFCIFYKTEYLNNGAYNDDLLNKSNTEILKGIFIVILIFAHLTQCMHIPNFLRPLRIGGNLTNIIFLFLSGYCMMESFKNKKNYLNNFIHKRLKRVYFPFIVMNVIIVVFNSIIFKEYYTIKDFILSNLQIRYLNGGILWYIVATLLFYSAFYITFKYLPKKAPIISLFIFSILYIITCLYLKLGSWWYNSAFCFPLGAYISYTRNNLLEYIKKRYFLSFIIVIIGTGVTFYFFLYRHIKFEIIWSTAFSIFLIFFIIILLLKARLKSKVLTFLGGISYEIYLVHIFLLNSYFRIITTRAGYTICLFLFITIILSIGLKKITIYKIRLNTRMCS